jgi:hypothetical protein
MTTSNRTKAAITTKAAMTGMRYTGVSIEKEKQ